MDCINISLLSTSSTAQPSVPAAVTVPVQGLEQLLVVVVGGAVGGAVGRQLDEATSSLLVVEARPPPVPTSWVGGVI
jgi:hypothetical protein